MAQVTDDWTDVEKGFAWFDEYKRWRPIVAAMRRLGAAIRADPRFHDLYPSLSHACFVFRRHANRAVFAGWNDEDNTYGFAFVEYPFDLKEPRKADAARMSDVLDMLLEYLDQAPP